MSSSWDELKAMPDERLHELYRGATQSVGFGAEWWRDEIVRRENERMAKQMRWLTLAAVVAALASVIVSIVALVVAAH